MLVSFFCLLLKASPARQFFFQLISTHEFFKLIAFQARNRQRFFFEHQTIYFLFCGPLRGLALPSSLFVTPLFLLITQTTFRLRQIYLKPSSEILKMPFIHSTCGCFRDGRVMCDVLACYCCQAARQCEALEGFNDTFSCLSLCQVIVCCPVAAACLRCRTSDRLQLGEHCMTSTVCGCLLPCCSLCMTARELNLRGHFPGGCLVSPESRMGQME